MSKISKIAGAIQIGELGALAQAVAARYAQAADALSGDAILAALMKSEKAEADAIISAINRTKNASSLDEKDAARDEAITALFDTAKAYTLLGTAAEKETAKKVSAILEKYRGIAHLNNANESAQIASLLEDLDKEGNKASVDALANLAAAASALKAAEADFLAAQKAQEDAKINAGDSATAVKKRLLALMNDKVVPYLNIAADTVGGAYSDLAAQAALAVSKSNAVVTARAKHA